MASDQTPEVQDSPSIVDRLIKGPEERVLGNLLMASGGLVFIGGLAVEAVTDGDVGKLVVLCGMGAAALGGGIKAVYKN